MVARTSLAIVASLAAALAAAQNPPPPTPPPQAPPVQQAPPATGTPETPVVAIPSPQVPSFTVVIDPGHGGTDAGARGSGGVLEKDVVMALAQRLRSTLERQGLRVVMTRQAGDNPSYDDRAGTANAYRGSLLVVLHAASTGTVGTARTYFSPPAGSEPEAAIALPAAPGEPRAMPKDAPAPRPIGLVRWEAAQQPHTSASRQLAIAMQKQIAQKLEKSPTEPAAASLRDLRSIAAPAVAVELASVSVKDRAAIDPYLNPLAEAIALGIRAFRGGAGSSGGAQ